MVDANGTDGISAAVLPEILPDVSSTSERLTSLIGGWKLFAEHPIFGAGLGAFRNEGIMTIQGVPLVIHSTPMWLLAELGLVGFLVLAGVGGYVFLSEWRRASTDTVSALIILCLVGFAIMSLPADMMYQRSFWLIIGAALSVAVAR